MKMMLFRLLGAIGLFLSVTTGHASSLRLDARVYHRVEQFLGAAEISLIREFDSRQSPAEFSATLQRSIDSTSTKSVFVTKLLSEAGSLVGITILFEDGGATQVLATHRFFIYLPDPVLRTDANTATLRSLFEVNLERARRENPSRPPTLILGPQSIFPRETTRQNRMQGSTGLTPPVRVEQMNDDAVTRFQRIHQITRDLGFHVYNGQLPRIMPGHRLEPSEQGTGNPGAHMTARAINSFPRVELDNEKTALLAGYRWFGTLRYASRSVLHYFPRREQHHLEITNLFSELAPDPEGPLLRRFPEFNTSRLSQGIDVENLDGRAFIVSAFHGTTLPRRPQFTLFVQVAQDLGAPEWIALHSAIEQLVQREMPYPSRQIDPSATAGERPALEFIVQARNAAEESAVLEGIEARLRSHGVMEGIEARGMRVVFTGEISSRVLPGPVVENLPWREFRFPGTPAAERAHLIVHENGRAQVVEPRTHTIEGSRYVRWEPTFEFFLTNPLEGRVEALTSRRLAIHYPGYSLNLIRGPSGWRAELKDTCQRLILGERAPEGPAQD